MSKYFVSLLRKHLTSELTQVLPLVHVGAIMFLFPRVKGRMRILFENCFCTLSQKWFDLGTRSLVQFFGGHMGQRSRLYDKSWQKPGGRYLLLVVITLVCAWL